VERGKGIDVAGMASEKVSLLQCCEGVAGGGAVLASPTIAVVVVPPAPATKSKSRSFNNHRRTPTTTGSLLGPARISYSNFKVWGLPSFSSISASSGEKIDHVCPTEVHAPSLREQRALRIFPRIHDRNKRSTTAGLLLC
jgi:hypothetical protein